MYSLASWALITAATSASLIQEISKKDFQNLIGTEKFVLTAFTSKSAESYNAFNKDFETAAAAIKSPLVTIDCGEEPELCRQYDINAYPAVRLFEGENKTRRYRGPRTPSAIISYMTREQLPSVSDVQAANIEEFKNINDVVVIAYLDADDSELSKAFRAVAARKHHDLVFGMVTDKAAAKAAGVAVPALGCYKNGVDSDNTVMNGKFDEETVEKFLEMVVPPFIGEFNEKTMNSFLTAGKLVTYIFVETPLQRKSMRQELTPVAKKYQQYVKFGVLDAVEYRPMAMNMGLSEDAFPALVVHNMMSDQVFSITNGRGIKQASVDKLLLAVLQGQATPGEQVEQKGEDVSGIHDEL